jgi:ankyrin repeat protein
VELLIEEGADVNYVVPGIGFTALHWAAYNDDVETCALLLNKGAEFKYSLQNTYAVDIAGILEHEDLVAFLTRWLMKKVDKPSAKELESGLSHIAK